MRATSFHVALLLVATLAIVSLNHSAEGKKVFWGALIGSQFTGQQAPADWNAVKKFEKVNAGGKKVTALHHGGNWYSGGCGGYCRFDAGGLGNIVNNKALPVYAWGSTTDATANAGAFLNSAIAAGSQDAYIRQWAQDAKAFGHKLIVCPNWEMNGNWYPWAPQKTGGTGTAADYVNAWRRIFNIVRKEVGAKNVLFGWVPNVDPTGWWAKQSGYALKAMYPGNSFVDYVGMDGYNGGVPWTSFKALFGPTYKELLKISKNKPVFILEVGCTESAGNKAKWIKDMFRDLPKSFSKIKMFLWYDRADVGVGNHKDWSIESSKKSSNAFKAGIKSNRY